MKKYVLIFFVGLFCCQLSGFANIANQTLESSPKTTTKEVSIYEDIIIVVRDYFDGAPLYGDKITNPKDTLIECRNDAGQTQEERYSTYGGETFESKMNELNLNHDWNNYIQRNDTQGICLNLQYQDLPEILEISFYGSIHYGTVKDGWCADKNSIYKLKVIKTTKSEEEDTLSSLASKTGETVDGLASDHKSAEHVLFRIGELDITLPILLECIAVFAVISLFVLIFARINSLNKKLNRLNTDVKVKEHESGIPGKDIYAVINGSDVQAYIKKIIAKSTEDYIQSRKPVFAQPEIDVVKIKEVILAQVKSEIQTIIAGQIENYLQNRQSVSEQPAVEKPSQISEIKQPEFRTTKVQYYPDSNSFIISENSQNEIFELYSENGEYYYTIVNDPVLRKEMLGILPSYRQCIEIRQDSPTISDVEVIRDGKLIKNGDVYNIDSGCVLQLSLK